MDNPLDKLNPGQRAFVEHYSVTGHGTNSAIEAGYSPKTAASQANRLLKQAKIREALRYIQDGEFIELGESREWIISRLTENATATIERWVEEPIYDDAGNEVGTSRTLVGKGNVANKALETLAKMGGHLTEKIDVDVKADIKVTLNGVNLEDLQ